MTRAAGAVLAFLLGVASAVPQAGAAELATADGAIVPAGTTEWANESLADLFVALTHDLEWGGRRPHLVRYEVPVTVGIDGPGAERHVDFLDAYLAALRANAGVPIARGPAPHNLVVRFVPGDEFRRRVPRHYCVVAAGSPGWDAFSRSPRRYGTRPFETDRAVTAMTVFIPDTAEPALVRACLLEEIAQALGPANDLYGLGPSIFNDDAAHVWPTRLDYLMLRVLYAPEMRTGLNRAETRARARIVLDRLNPQGRAAPPLPRLLTRDMADWTETMRAAFDRSRSARRRLASAREALAIAVRRAPGSAYHCRSLQALARASAGDGPAALEALATAARVCSAAHGADDIRVAQIRLDEARLLYAAGDAEAADKLADGLEEVFAAHGQEDRLTALYALRSAILHAGRGGTPLRPAGGAEADDFR